MITANYVYIPALTDHLIAQFQSVSYPVELCRLSFPFLVLIPSVSALIEAYSLNWEVAIGKTISYIYIYVAIVLVTKI